MGTLEHPMDAKGPLDPLDLVDLVDQVGHVSQVHHVDQNSLGLLFRLVVQGGLVVIQVLLVLLVDVPIVLQVGQVSLAYQESQDNLGLPFHLVLQGGLVDLLDQVLPRALLLLVVEASL